MLENMLFEQACNLQSEQRGPLSEFSIACNRVAFQAVAAAADDAMNNKAVYHIVSSGTGTGKTTFCISLLATCFINVPNYSAAYVVATIEDAQRIYNSLAKLLPAGVVAIHTSAHQTDVSAREHGTEVHGHYQTFGKTSRAHLMESPVIICTHELWVREGVEEGDYGVRRYKGAFRSNVILDECPETSETADVVISSLEDLANEVERLADYSLEAELVRRAVTAFRRQCGTNGRRFDVAQLISNDDLARLRAIDLSRLGDVRQPEAVRKTLAALVASGTGHGFLWRSEARAEGEAAGHKTLVTYTDHFRPHPGLVILDATAEHAMPANGGCDYQHHSGPTVDYRNLELTSLQCARFKGMSWRKASASEIRDYIGWIAETLIQHTTEGEDVLVVAPKRVVGKIDPHSLAPGRKVQVVNWGRGIGSNQYRDCGAVFLFSEHHLPRFVYLARSLAKRQRRATEHDMRAANGSALTGHVEDMRRAHLLRWFKQLACRGRVRHIDCDGVAAPMRLYTTMDRTLLLDSYAKLFPGAAHLTFINSDPEAKQGKGERLFGLLAEAMQARKALRLAADVIEDMTDVPAKELGRVFGSKRCEPFRNRGWNFVPGSGRKAAPALVYAPQTMTVAGFGPVTL